MTFKLPIKTAWMDEQMKHEPSRAYAEEIHQVVSQYKPDYELACEIGNAWGISTLAILTAGEGKLVSVDKGEPVRALEEMKAHDLLYRCRFVQQDSEDFWESNQQKFDLLYVDGSHLYEDVLVDFVRGWKRLKPGGLFICDDFIHPANLQCDPARNDTVYGVGQALWQMVVKYGITQIGTTKRLFWTIK